MNHSSVFINDSSEAAIVIDEISDKGPIYSAFRFDPAVPDILACDEAVSKLRKQALAESIENMKLKDTSKILKDLMDILLKHSESGEPFDMKSIYTYFALDCICEVSFNYPLQAMNGSLEGKQLFQSLSTLLEYQSGQGIYPNTNARKVTSDELIAAKNIWKVFLQKIVKYIQSEAEQYRVIHGQLDVSNNYALALVHLLSVDNPTTSTSTSSSSSSSFDEHTLMCEVHQVLRHGHECLAGMLQWITYVLYRVKKVSTYLGPSPLPMLIHFYSLTS
jgi:cytochrome P450